MQALVWDHAWLTVGQPTLTRHGTAHELPHVYSGGLLVTPVE